MNPETAEKIELAIGSLGNAIDLLGNVYNDLRDALNEFVSNAYDEFVQAGVSNGVVGVRLMPKARPPRIVISDNGRGIARPDLQRIARSIAKSDKPGAAGRAVQTIGEKGIGILGFQALAEHCHIYTRHHEAGQTFCLELTKGSTEAVIRPVDRENLLEIPGTEVHLLGVSEQTFRVLTLPKLVEYFRERWRQALASDQFTLTITQGTRHERVRPGKFEGELFLRRVRTDLGYVEFELYLSPRTQKSRRVAVVGVAGVQILRDLAADPEFARHPWDSDQVQGEIRFAALRQTTGRRGLQHDRRVFPVFAAAVAAVEPDLTRQIDLLNREQDSIVDSRLTRAIRQAFNKALAEIQAVSTAGLKVSIADPAGLEDQGTLFDEETAAAVDRGGMGGEVGEDEAQRTDVRSESALETARNKPVVEGERGRSRQSSAAGLSYMPFPFDDTRLRSRYNSALRRIEVNSIHPDYRRAREHDRRTFLDYLIIVISKELTLLNYQGIDPSELMDRYAELLARVQLHLPKRV